MTILVIGATGRVGRHVVQQLVNRNASVRVLTRDVSKADFPANVGGNAGMGHGCRQARERLRSAEGHRQLEELKRD